MNRDERVVVVGGGLTGLRAAERLRELKFEGEITILGDEKLPPYHRPALSKQLLKGELRSSDLTLPAYEDLNARWRFGTQVRQLIPNKKTLVLPGGEEMTYDGLIIATGVEAKKQNGVPYHDPRVLDLRTMADGRDLERVIGATKGRVAVIGGGFTGCELAASLRHLSREVTLIGRGKNLLGNVLGEDLGEWLTNMHREHGVDLALGNSVTDWNPTSEGIGLKLTDGSTLVASCVILAAGTVPMTHWLRGSGLPLDNGVVCEPTCHVVGADDVVAAGDVAQWPNLRFDNVPRRVEHWLNAVEMGRAAAESLLTGRENAEPFCPMPRFWTDQYSARIQAAGMIKLGKDIVKLGTPDEGTGTVYGFSLEGRLMGVVGVDCPTAMIAWGESVSRQNPEPRPRIEAGTSANPSTGTQAPVPAVVGGGLQKRKAGGKHIAPAKAKQPQREERREHAIGFVEEQRPAELSGPIGVGAGRVPVTTGGPRNVVDSFSRMLPVAVRPQAGGPPPGMPPNGRPPLPLTGPGSQGRNSATGTFGPTPNPNGGPGFGGSNGSRGPANAPFGDGASSGAFNNGSTSGAFNNGATSGAFNNGSTSGAFATGLSSPFTGGSVPNGNANALANGGSAPNRNGASRTNGGPVSNGNSFGSNGHAPGTNGHVSGSHVRPVNGHASGSHVRPANGHAPGSNGHAVNGHASGSNGHVSGSHVRPVNGIPTNPFGTPANGRALLGPATNRIPAQDPTGSRPARPQFSAAEMTDVRTGLPEPLSGRLGPSESLPIDVTGQMALLDANGHVRTPEFSDPTSSRGPADSFSGMPPVSRGSDSARMRGPEKSFSAMPPARRDGSGMPAGRGAEDSFSAMPPARNGRPRGAEDSYSALPPARRDGAGMPARGPVDSFSGMPPVSRGSDSARMPVARRDPEDSYSSMPPARRSADSGRMPVARGAEDSFSALPPARRDDSGRRSTRGAEDSFSALPPARRSAASDSYSALPPARRDGAGMPATRSVEDSFGALAPVRRSSEDSYSAMPPTRHGIDSRISVDDTAVATSTRAGRRRAAEDSYSTMPAASDGRRAAHRAEDLASEFGRPPRRRSVEPEISLMPAMSSVDDLLEPPERMPKHGRPEDYGHVPSSRPGPEDSYDRMQPIERSVHSSGGRRRARA
jgi:NADPH-dependent 2,4-dienoyl-CoA reductase/sulfur reductase-like enzyme